MTFDLWNTLVTEGAAGLFVPRVRLWATTLRSAGLGVPDDELERAHRAALTDYQAAWLRNAQFTSEHATRSVLAALAIADCPDRVHEELISTFHAAGLESDIDTTPNALTVLTELCGRGIECALICDIGLTPSSALTHHLRRLGLVEHLRWLTWSDELGVYKPDREAFAHTLRHLSIEPRDAVHVGDRLRTDVTGARSAGMATVRYRGIFDDTDPIEEADHVIDDLTELLPIVGVSR